MLTCLSQAAILSDVPRFAKQNWFWLVSDQFPNQITVCVFPVTPLRAVQKVHKAAIETVWMITFN